MIFTYCTINFLLILSCHGVPADVEGNRNKKNSLLDDVLDDIVEETNALKSLPGNVNSKKKDNPPLAEGAPCQLRETVHEFDQNEGSFLFPRCVTTNQCGGCCFLKNFKCLPTKIKNKTVVVTKGAGGKFENVQFTVPSHEECKCQCPLKESDCPRNFRLDASDCRCTCDLTKTCIFPKVPSGDCDCKCFDNAPCDLGMVRNEDNCRCEYVQSP